MWRLVVIITAVYIISIESRAIEPLEGPLWPERLSSIASKEIFNSNNNLEGNNQRDIQQEFYNTDTDYDLIFPKFPQDKRALAIIGRWGSFSNIGKQRTPIRSNPVVSGFDGNKNTQPGTRMLGQPLRWG